MFDLRDLERYLKDNRADFALIGHTAPILTVQDAEQYFDVRAAAPAFVVQTERGLMLLIAGAKRGRLDFKALGAKLGLSKLKLADKKKAEQATGCKIGAIPLVGSGLPCIFDDQLLQLPFLYGGSGDAMHTLKIAPQDVKRLNHTILTFV